MAKKTVNQIVKQALFDILRDSPYCSARITLEVMKP
jgi:hypothetical protein